MTIITAPSLKIQNFSLPLQTEGIKYAGSKLKLIGHILEMIQRTKARSVLDGFSGTTRLSQALAKSGYRVVSNDIAVFSYVFSTCYLLNKDNQSTYSELIAELNATPAKSGWFTHHYGGYDHQGSAEQKDGTKKPWQIHNTQKLDGIREKIHEMKLSPVQEAVALTSLILALDRVDNTMGHYVSYLKRWSPRSYQPLHLKVPQVFENSQDHSIFCKDVFDVSKQEVDHHLS